MRNLSVLALGLALTAGFWVLNTTSARAQESDDDATISLLDRCDPATFPSGLCVGTSANRVTFAQFGALLFSPLIATVVGHPAWTFAPTYVNLHDGHTVRVTNNGGENHTFTEVTAFGGGFVPPLNGTKVAGKTALTPAPACVSAPGPVIVAPGKTMQIQGLAPGVHIFQCCIHPWMRAVVAVSTGSD